LNAYLRGVILVAGDNMKKFFLQKSLSILKQNYPDINEVQLDEYRYGLEGFYLTVTKSLIIIPLAFLLGIGKELLILLLFYNILREYACGLHATKSWICLLSSGIIFILIPVIAKNIILSFPIKLILSVLAVILIFIYAPADTVKAPIIKKKNRIKKKIISTILCIVYVVMSILSPDQLISNLILVSIYIEIILIVPISYKIFHLPYNNYKTYRLINHLD
jgi:accessory gene regulator B